MHANIMEAFSYIGAPTLLTMRYGAYDALTSEFMSTVSTTITNPTLGGTITFYLGNKHRTVTLEEWNVIF